MRSTAVSWSLGVLPSIAMAGRGRTHAASTIARRSRPELRLVCCLGEFLPGDLSFCSILKFISLLKLNAVFNPFLKSLPREDIRVNHP